MPSIEALTIGDAVTLHSGPAEYPAVYQGHDRHAAVVELTQVLAIPATSPITVRWNDPGLWIADRLTDEAFYLPTSEPALPVPPPERE